MEKLKSNLNLIKRLIPYYKQNLGIFLLDLTFAISTSILDLSFPLLMKHFIKIIEFPQTNLVFELTKLAFFYLIVITIELIGTYYINYIGHSMGAKIETSMRNDLFVHCQKLPISYHDNNKIGQIISRLTNDLFEIGEFAHHAPEDILIVLMKLIIPFTVLFDFNPVLTLIVYGLLLPIMVIISLFFKKMKTANHKTRVEIGELNSKIEDSLLGIKLVKSFANEPFEQKKFNVQNKKTLATKISFYRTYGLFMTFNRLFYCIEVLIFILGGSLILKNNLIEGTTLIIYTGYVDRIMAAIYKILNVSDIYQKGLTGINRFCEIVDIPIAKKKNPIKLNQAKVKGKIEFKNVYFSYEDKSKPIINNLNLKIEPNEKIAIVGSSGSGKTTICNLLKNFYTIQKGEILIDNINIEKIESKSLHNIIGLIQQNVYLFTGTILDNIRFGKLDANFEEIVEAARKAKILNFINSLENKFHTNIGERGNKLSGGQKQQISIARLFLKKPKILIFDEATSSLDSENERLIMESIEELSKNKTTITIAHKLTTIKKADTIYLIKNGNIVEKGTHNSLMKNSNSNYRKFYNNFLI